MKIEPPADAIPQPADPDELFDIVDEADQVVGRASRREVHARKLLHRAIHVLVHNWAGQLFLQQRSLSKDSSPGCWDSSCSGHVDAGENYAQAAWRELGEELGWRDRSLPLRPLLKLPAGAETGQEFIEIYLLGPLDGPFVLHPEEIIGGRWASAEEIDQLVMETPEAAAKAMSYLWLRFRAEILAAIS